MIDLATVTGEALTSDELDRVAGGIIIVSGFQRQFELVHQSSVLERISINPQPLPPGGFSFGR